MGVRLHLLRHAKSSWDDASLDDFQRPLSPRGRRAAGHMRRHLEQAHVRPTLVLCSTAVRARETLDRVLPGLVSPEVAYEDGLYLASGNALLGRIREVPNEVSELLLVGHNPGLHELALLLADDEGRRPLAGKLPTGALVTLEFPGRTWPSLAAADGTLTAFVKPREL